MAGNLVNVPKLVKDILTRWSQAKADYVDDNISTKASQSTADSILANADTTTSSRAAQSTADSILANADTPTSSRASQSSVNAIPTTAIKSIQRGWFNPSGDNASGINSINISSVNTSKSVLSIVSHDITDPGTTGTNRTYLKFINSSTLELHSSYAGSSGDYKYYTGVYWQVVEYY